MFGKFSPDYVCFVHIFLIYYTRIRNEVPRPLNLFHGGSYKILVQFLEIFSIVVDSPKMTQTLDRLMDCC